MARYNQLSQEAMQERAKEAIARLEACEICPRHCKVNRLKEEKGFCRIGRNARVYSCTPHFGEEPPLVGRYGSGTIFFSGCNLACVFCQNYDISQMDSGQEVDAKGLAKMMVRLQDLGCHNINFVTPSHVVPQILEALVLAREEGLSVPLVYNSGGYDRVETIRLLDGIFDIYMPDAKYGRDETALKYSIAPQYTHYMKTAIKEMHRQVGIFNRRRWHRHKGLLRHLVLPGCLADTAEVVRFRLTGLEKHILKRHGPTGQSTTPAVT
jgi:putative pyruvate formate lyase activating enzyme